MKTCNMTNYTLLTDLYQLTMAYGYWRTGKANEEAVFNLFYRKAPFGGGYAISCGLDYVLDFIEHFHFDETALNYLKSLKGNDGKPLFCQEFLEYLANLKLTCNIHALKEGTPVFPFEPILRVQGPLLQCQLVETALLNIINFQTLIATKAARICQAAEMEPILEFGLRRAQGSDGALTAARAAYIGGCAATSNVLAGQLFGIPVKGTHAHSWVMSFDTEEEAFAKYAEVMPNNCILLVDTYNTITGIQKAVKTAQQLQKQGHKLLGIRLDSGDLAKLSCQAREILDQAGLHDCKIVASNDLDEFSIEQLKRDGAQIDIWGIGTKLVTAHDQPALGGVYKLAALKKADGNWSYPVKYSDDPIKQTTPGILQIRRLYKNGKMTEDKIYDELTQTPAKSNEEEDLLEPVVTEGQSVYFPPCLADTRNYTLTQLKLLPEKYKRNQVDQQYPVSLPNPDKPEMKNAK